MTKKYFVVPYEKQDKIDSAGLILTTDKVGDGSPLYVDMFD